MLSVIGPSIREVEFEGMTDCDELCRLLDYMSNIEKLEISSVAVPYFADEYLFIYLFISKLNLSTLRNLIPAPSV